MTARTLRLAKCEKVSKCNHFLQKEHCDSLLSVCRLLKNIFPKRKIKICKIVFKTSSSAPALLAILKKWP